MIRSINKNIKTMYNRNHPNYEKKNSVQQFTNLQSIHTVTSFTVDNKMNDSFDRNNNSITHQDSKKGLDKDINSNRSYTNNGLYNYQSIKGVSNNSKITNDFQPDMKPSKDTKYMTEDEIEFQNIDLKKFKISDFDLGMKLGKGKFGNVYLAREKNTNYIVALKILNKMEIQRLNGEKLIVREIKIHSYVDHPNIIKLYGFFHDDQNIYLILEYAPDGEVYQELKKSVT